MAKSGFEISLGLTGILTLWSGIMKIGEKGGIVHIITRLVGPFFNKLFPDLGKDHPAYGPMMMNIAANMMGLDNAATPMGLQAMKEMQETNLKKDTASNPMIMFLVLNASGLTILPISIMVYRAQLGAKDPSDIFIPILFATFFSTLAGMIAVSIYQGIRLWDKVVVAYLGGLMLVVGGILFWMNSLPQEQIAIYSRFGSNFILFSIIIFFLFLGIRSKINEPAREPERQGIGVEDSARFLYLHGRRAVACLLARQPLPGIFDQRPPARSAHAPEPQVINVAEVRRSAEIASPRPPAALLRP
jgi:spore maturation protein SpmA